MILIQDYVRGIYFGILQHSELDEMFSFYINCCSLIYPYLSSTQNMDGVVHVLWVHGSMLLG